MIRILIADDHKLVREILEYMFKENRVFRVIATAKNGMEAIRMTIDEKPDILLLDLEMPDINGIEVTKTLKENNISTKIIVLTASSENEDLNLALCYGADAYILKNIGKNQLFLAIQSVFSGMQVIQKPQKKINSNYSPKMIKKKNGKTIITIEDIDVELNERDLELIKMIVDSMSIEKIAEQLFVSEGRARNLITDLINKMMVKDRTQLAVFAIKNKLI